MDGFTFYRSFYETIKRINKKQERAEAIIAICEYMFENKEPEILSETAAIAFEGFRHTLNKCKKNGGNAKKRIAKTSENAESNEDRNGIENESNQNRNEIETESKTNRIMNETESNENRNGNNFKFKFKINFKFKFKFNKRNKKEKFRRFFGLRNDSGNFTGRMPCDLRSTSGENRRRLIGLSGGGKRNVGRT